MSRRLLWVKRALAIMCLVLLAEAAWGVEPSGTPVADAIHRGALAFLGGVVSATEVRRSGEYVSEVELVVAVSHCLYGDACRRRANLRVRYWASSDQDHVVPVSFEVGARYLWVFRRPARSSPVSFDTTWAGGWTDMAYVIRGGVGDLAEDEEHLMTNIWNVGKPESVSVRQLREWTAFRE